MKVLIVDDEYQACEGLMNRIDRMGFKQIDEISCFTKSVRRRKAGSSLRISRCRKWTVLR